METETKKKKVNKKTNLRKGSLDSRNHNNRRIKKTKHKPLEETSRLNAGVVVIVRILEEGIERH